MAELTALVDRAEAHLEVERQTERAIAAAYRQRLDSGLEAGALSLAAARELFAKVGPMQREDSARYASQLANLEVLDVLSRYDRFDDTSHAAVGREFWTMLRSGKRPSERNTIRDFWGGILLYLESREEPDLEVYEEGLGVLEKTLGDSRAYRKFLAARRTAFEGLRSKNGTTVGSKKLL